MKYNYEPENLKDIILDSTSFSEVLRKLNIPIQGNNSQTLKNILIKKDIDFSHFTGRAKNYSNNYVDASEYLKNGSTISSHSLKEKLLKENLKINGCEICGIKE